MKITGKFHGMNSYLMYPAVMLLMLSGILACNSADREQTPELILKEHIEWLASDERAGRLAGTLNEAESATYIENQFLQFGLVPAGDEDIYLQQFTLSGPMAQAMEVENYLSRNVLGMVRGTEYPDQYIIIGAHYDGQGNGGIISMDHDGERALHNSADDNASGTAGLLWLAKQFSEQPAERSVLFAAFSGEELGLLGSRYMAGQLQISRDSILAMINLDMIGRLNGSGLTIFGTGTSPVWSDLLEETAVNDSLTIVTASSGTGASDHTSFYDIGIPVLHYFSGTHEQYHRENDTSDLIDLSGMVMILDHVEEMIRNLAGYDADDVGFTETGGGRSTQMPTDGVTLGVIPDYSWPGTGFRIESVRSGSAADNAGIQSGDVIVRMGSQTINDIYGYMEALGEFSRGQTIMVQVLRDDRAVNLEVTF
jgi:hypothetical protein